MRKSGADLLNDSIYKSLLVFAAPLLLSNVFQHLYNTADMLTVGHYLGEKSLAAIGSSSVIFDMLVRFAIGVGGGFNIVLARSFGSGDETLLKRSSAGAVVLGGLLIVFITITGSLFLKPLLNLLNTPADIFNEAYSYISVLILFSAVLFIYNLCAGFLQAIGNSFMPLIFLILSSVLNIALDLLFIIVFDMGVRGAAAATVAAQGVSAVCCLIYIYYKCPILAPKKVHFRFDAGLYKELASQGFSMGFMLLIVTMGTAVLQSAINNLGYLVIAGHITGRRINSFFMMPVVAITIALSTFVSQNKGANQLQRIRKAVRYGNMTAIGWSIFISIILLFSSASLVKLLSGSGQSAVIENGSLYLMITAPFYVVLGPLLNFRLALQGIGKKIVPIVSSVVELIGKVIFAFLLVPMLGYFGVVICEPAIWCVMLIILLYSFYTNPYIQGKTES
jgi:putative MATE family efflux protein